MEGFFKYTSAMASGHKVYTTSLIMIGLRIPVTLRLYVRNLRGYSVGITDKKVLIDHS
jgi:hypothetical protein